MITGRPPNSPSSSPLFPLLLLGVAVAGCRSSAPRGASGGPGATPPASSIRFADVAPSSGITFRYNFGDFTYDNILESSGSGVAAFDADGDGRMDLLFLNGRYVEGANDPKGRWFAGATNALWRNEGNGTFSDITAKSGVGGRSWAMAATVADLDGDGRDDLFFSNYGPNTFLHANGDGTFSDRTEEAGLAGPATLHGFPKWSVGAAAFDADGDGRLELAVGNFLAFDPAYVSASAPERMPSPAEYRGQGLILYRRGDDGRWRDVTAGSGLERPDVRVMGLTALDCDDDGRLDLFSANDHEPNTLFRNLGGGRFEEIAAAAGVAVNLDGVGTGHMHATPGDVDGDGRIDLLVTDLSYGGLFRAVAPCRYEDVVETSGVRRAMDGAESWGASLADFDNDGDVDLFAANGTADVLALKRPTLLANDGRGRFVDVAPGAGDYFTTLHSGRGAATLDFDDDGRLDLVVSHVDLSGRPALLRNTTESRNHWIGLRLVPAPGRPEPVGATVRVTAGGRTQTRLFQRSRSYLSVDDPRIHFGLGSAEAVERIEVRWPGGTVQALRDLPVDRYHDVAEPAR